MIAAYERACDRENVETTESTAGAPRRQTNYLAIASFVCNLVCSFAARVLIHNGHYLSMYPYLTLVSIHTSVIMAVFQVNLVSIANYSLVLFCACYGRQLSGIGFFTAGCCCALGQSLLSASAFFLLVHGQVTIIFVVSVCLSVCLFVCAEFFSAVFDPI